MGGRLRLSSGLADSDYPIYILININVKSSSYVWSIVLKYLPIILPNTPSKILEEVEKNVKRSEERNFMKNIEVTNLVARVTLLKKSGV